MPLSAGASVQKGDAGPSSASGSSHAISPHAAAARSAADWVRTGKGPASIGSTASAAASHSAA